MKSLLLGGLLVPLLIACNSEKHADYTTRTISPVPAPSTVAAREAEMQNAGGVKKAAAVFVPEEAPAVTPELIAQGKTIYEANCTSCHNKNPSQPGSIGPAQAQTPWEVVKVKVVTGRYPEALPPGYTPARKTKAMRAFPKLEGNLPAIWAYLQSFK